METKNLLIIETAGANGYLQNLLNFRHSVASSNQILSE